MHARNITPLSALDDSQRPTDMRTRQMPLRQLYRQEPQAAVVVDSARTTSANVTPQDPIHSSVHFGHGRPADLTTGVHRKVGGNCDMPNPGEILSAALASCLDSTIRIVANLSGIELYELEVSVDGIVDTRGTLMVDQDVPVGFQTINVHVHIAAEPAVPQARLDRLLAAAESSCVVLQTLKSPPHITIERT